MSVKSTLFATRSYPMKTALEGFVYPDMLKATKLIMMHGGTVTTEPDDDTITLSPPNGTSTADYARFSINWIHDCISADKFVDIMKYVLPALKLGDNTPSVKSEPTTSCHGNLHTHSVGHGTFSPADSTSPTDAPSTPTNTETSKIEKIRSKIVNDSCYRGDYKKEVGSNFTRDVKATQISDIIVISSDSEDGNFEEVRNSDKYKQILNNSTTEPSTNCNRVLRKSEWRSLQRINYPKKRNGTHFTEEENQRMVDYLIKNDAILRAGGNNVWKDAKAKGMFVKPPRSADTLRKHFLNSLRGNVEQYTDSSVVLKKFAQREKQTKKKAVKHKYSKKEDEQIIKYLIENRAIGVAYIWRRMEADNIFQNPYRSAASLKSRFMNFLLQNYKNCTKNPEARREFEELFGGSINEEK